MSTLSQTIPTQGLHHITLTGAGRKITLDFWEGVLGMPFVFEQPNRTSQTRAICILILGMIV